MKKRRVLNFALVFMLVCSFLLGDPAKLVAAKADSGKTIQVTKKDVKMEKSR
ncbi:hypothetical protein [Acetivibrio ethanolgignens]|uniref:hypothetical protein n=1 Tax=Acetivibrio ethanolgignens TaxID=290052 RepID=UPI0012DEE984|nr:hypothetical protein [Acetivibrio ethanolgignens]